MMQSSIKSLYVMGVVMIFLSSCSFLFSDAKGGGGDDDAGVSLRNDASASLQDSSFGDAGQENDANVGVELPAPLVRYRITQADSMSTPLMLLDDSGNNLHMPITVSQASGSTNPVFVEDESGNYNLRFDNSVDRPDHGGGVLPIFGTPLYQALQGTKTVTMVAKYKIDECNNSSQRIFGISNGGTQVAGWLMIREWLNNQFFMVHWNGENATSVYSWSPICPSQSNDFTTVHWVVDSNADNFIRAFINGVEDTDLPDAPMGTFSGSLIPSAGQTIDLVGGYPANMSSLVLGREAADGRIIKANIAYVALYKEALTPAQVKADADHLANADDTPRI